MNILQILLPITSSSDISNAPSVSKNKFIKIPIFLALLMLSSLYATSKKTTKEVVNPTYKDSKAKELSIKIIPLKTTTDQEHNRLILPLRQKITIELTLVENRHTACQELDTSPPQIGEVMAPIPLREENNNCTKQQLLATAGCTAFIIIVITLHAWFFVRHI